MYTRKCRFITCVPEDDEIQDGGRSSFSHGVEPVVVGPVKQLLEGGPASHHLVTDGFVDSVISKLQFF